MPLPLMHEKADEIERVETPFNTVIARRRGPWIDLDVEGATFASWHPTRLLTGYSWDGLSAAAMLLGQPSSVLLLGLGGGTCLHQLRALAPSARLVAIEIDPDVVGLARRHMKLDELDVEVHIVDADAFLASTGDRFDAVLDDLYLTGADDVVRERVPDGERLETLIARTVPGGLIAVNLIDDKGHKTVRRRARKAFREAFEDTKVVRPPRGLNEILVGRAPGGDAERALATRHDLQPLRDRFGEDRDKGLWDRIAVKKL